MERIRRYLERSATRENVIVESSSATAELYYGRLYDAKSIGSLSQRFFESDEDERYYGTCNGYTSQPGSKSNLLLCSECDQRTRTCTYRPRTPGSYVGRYVEERLDPAGSELALLRADRKTPPSTRSSPRSSPRSTHDRREIPPPSVTPTPTSLRDYERVLSRGSASPSRPPSPSTSSPPPPPTEPPTVHSSMGYRSKELREETRTKISKEVSDEDSPSCEICHGNGIVLLRCDHCDFSTEGDLICFRCQSDEGSSTNGNGSGCPRCERTTVMGIDEEEEEDDEDAPGKYPVDALVKIKLNDRAIDVVDSDDTNDSDPSIDRQRGQVDRLDTIVEVKGDTTASENDEENGADGTKLNGTTPARFFNYMIVLSL